MPRLQPVWSEILQRKAPHFLVGAVFLRIYEPSLRLAAHPHRAPAASRSRRAVLTISSFSLVANQQ